VAGGPRRRADDGRGRGRTRGSPLPRRGPGEAPGDGQRGSIRGARHFHPLLGFVIPTVLIGYGIVIPRSCIAGVNQLTIGFAATVVGACFAYWAGLRLVVHEREKGDGEV